MEIMANYYQHFDNVYVRNAEILRDILRAFTEASAMSGPTWLPPRTLDSPERAGPQVAHSAGSAAYRASSKMMAGMSDFRPKYGSYDPNGGGGGGGGGRFMAAGSTGEKQLQTSPHFQCEEDNRRVF